MQSWSVAISPSWAARWSWLSQLAIRFQLAKFRLTSLPSPSGDLRLASPAN